MSFEKIISIPGMPGLFKMVAQMRNGGFVVEGMADNKRIPVSAMQRIIMLKDISVYTMEEDMPLQEVFLKMKEHDKVASSVSTKADPADLKSTLKKIMPEFDEERVHVSDIRKMFSWYNLLKDAVSFEKEPEVKEAELVEASAEEVPKKKAKAKSAETKETNIATEETAPKKAAKVKSSEAKETNIEAEEATPKKTAKKIKAGTAESDDAPKAAKKTAKKSAKDSE